MSAIVKKLLRDLWGMRGQALAIALVIGSGVATFVATLSTMDALKRSQRSFYEDTRLGDAFAALKRAPNDGAQRLQALEGVSTVQTRVGGCEFRSSSKAHLRSPGRSNLPTPPAEHTPLLRNRDLRLKRSMIRPHAQTPKRG